MKRHTFSFQAMGGPCQLHLYGEQTAAVQAVAESAIQRVVALEKKYSRYRNDSVTTRINRHAGKQAVSIDAETAALLRYADVSFRQSQGLFDITSGILRTLWDFKSKLVPSPAQVEHLLPLIGWQRVAFDDNSVYLPEAGMELDFGGFVKEYAVDEAAQCCRDAGIQHGLIDLAGDLAVVGPHPDGAPWRVGVRHPRAPDSAIATIELSCGALASSGDYERYMEVNGRRYCHILNPTTGFPVRHFAGVSIHAERCLVAGTACTVTMLLEDAGEAWVRELGQPYFTLTASGEVACSHAYAQVA